MAPYRALPPWLLLLAPLALLATSARVVLDTYLAIPFWDQWENIAWWRVVLEDGLTLGRAAVQHNEHRILFPRLVFFADLHWFGGRNALSLAATGLVVLGSALLWLRLGWRRDSVLAALGGATAAALTVSLVQWENLTWAFQLQFVGVYLAGAVALVLFCGATEEAERVRPGPMAAAFVVLGLAAFSMANGLFAGVAMTLVALATRRGWTATLAPIGAVALLALLYFRGYQPVAGHSPPEYALSHPLEYLRYVLAYLGGLWSQEKVERAVAFGAAGVALTALMAFVVIRDRTREAARSACFGIVLFVGMTAGVTALGRLSFGVEQALASRYTTPGCWFWAAQAVFWTLHARARSWRAQLPIGAVVAVALVQLFALQAEAGKKPYLMRDRLLFGESAMRGGIDDQAALTGLYPEAAKVRDLIGFLRQERLSIFADERPRTPGEPFAAPLAEPGACVGAFDGWGPTAAGLPTYRANGWAWEMGAKRAARQVVVVDADRRVIGVGRSGTPRVDVPAVVKAVTDENAGWVVAAQPLGPGPVAAYAVLEDGRACQLGVKP